MFDVPRWHTQRGAAAAKTPALLLRPETRTTSSTRTTCSARTSPSTILRAISPSGHRRSGGHPLLSGPPTSNDIHQNIHRRSTEFGTQSPFRFTAYNSVPHDGWFNPGLIVVGPVVVVFRVSLAAHRPQWQLVLVVPRGAWFR